MKCAYQGGIDENKNILNEVIQNANALRNEVNSYWTQLEEEGKKCLYKYLYKITTTVKTIHVHVKG